MAAKIIGGKMMAQQVRSEVFLFFQGVVQDCYHKDIDDGPIAIKY